MPVFNVTVSGDEEAKAVLRGIIKAVPEILRDRRNILSNLLMRRIDKRYQRRRSPEGHPWRSLRGGIWPRRSGKGYIDPSQRNRILEDTGQLRKSIKRLPDAAGGRIITSEGSGIGFKIGVTGPAKDYAHVHQFGLTRSPITGGIIPKRRFLGVNKGDAQAVSRRVLKQLLDVARSYKCGAV